MGEIQPKSFAGKSGAAYTVRTALPEDAEKALRYHKKIFSETPSFMLTTAEEFQISVEQEKQFLQHMLEHEGKLALIAEDQEEMIGFLDFQNGHKLRNRHQGIFGMSVAQNYRNQGIGKALLSELLAWADKNPSIEKVGLEVVADNHGAVGLYKSFGFVEEGRKAKALKIDSGTYYDLLIMAYFPKNDVPR